MKKICVFLFLFFGYSEGMNISCVNSTDLGNSTRLYKMCDVSAGVGENLPMLCNVSEYLIECMGVPSNGQAIRLGERISDIGAVLGWLWLGGRAVYKWLHSSPREDYMRSWYQRFLSSELLGFLITVPSIISIFTDASWGNYLINAAPLAVGVFQACIDGIKCCCSCRSNRRFDLFNKFMLRLERDLDDTKDHMELWNTELYRWACAEFKEMREMYGEGNEENFERYSDILNRFGESFYGCIQRIGCFSS